jgi:hypothetical protein
MDFRLPDYRGLSIYERGIFQDLVSSMGESWNQMLDFPLPFFFWGEGVGMRFLPILTRPCSWASFEVKMDRTVLEHGKS